MKRWLVAPTFGTVVSAVSFALGVVTLAAQARADSKGQVVAVVVEGAYADQVAGWLEDHVTAPDTLKEDRAFRGSLRARGVLPLRPAANDDARDVQLIARARAAGKEAGVDRVLLVDVHKTPRATRVHVWQIDVHEGVVVVDGDIRLAPSASAIETTRAILGLQPPRSTAAAEPAPAPASDSPAVQPSTPTGPAEVAPAVDRGTPAPPVDVDSSLFSVRAGLGVGMRHFSYVDRVTQSLRPYDLNGAPVAVVSGVVYPLAWTHLPVVRDFGITGEYGQAFALSSQDSAGDRVGTTWQSFDIGATQRIPLASALLADVSVGYGGNDFQFTQSLAGSAAALPSVAYRFVRFGADLRYRFLGFTAYAGGSYLDVLSSGFTLDLFPRESVGGVQGRIGGSYALTTHFEVSLNAAYTRMFYSFNPLPGDATVAGGALDEQTRIVAGFSYLM
jgi:hypothetical protein